LFFLVFERTGTIALSALHMHCRVHTPSHDQAFALT